MKKRNGYGFNTKKNSNEYKKKFHDIHSLLNSIEKRFDEIEIKLSSKWNRYSDFRLSSKLSCIDFPLT